MRPAARPGGGQAGPGLLEYLRQELGTRAIPATDDQHALIREWVELLMQWNRQYNLTACTGRDAVVRNLVVESLSAVRHLRGRRVLDVGSGAGVPGIPLAVYCPEKNFTLLDGNGKKTRFMEHCRMRLRLENVTVVKSRVETHRPALPFDTIISRACGGLHALITNSRHLAHRGTRWLAFKSRAQADELSRQTGANGANWRLETLGFCDAGQTRKLIGVTLEP